MRPPATAHESTTKRNRCPRHPFITSLCIVYLAFLIVNTLIARRMERHVDGYEEMQRSHDASSWKVLDSHKKIENINYKSSNNTRFWKGELLSPMDVSRYSSLAHSVYNEDKKIDPVKEEERCKRYGYSYDGRKTRRRIFWGSLIADDSWQTIYAHAAEAYGIYHTAAFVESNTTQTLSPRDLRFRPKSQNLKRLRDPDLFGPGTKVTVDYYFDGKDPPRDELHREHLQRQDILKRWKRNGMTKRDVGFLGDVDEVFSRDFLRALQICDVPQLRPGQDCRWPKIVAHTLIFHSTPECVVSNEEWYHPDIIIGECIDLIGDEKVHKPPLRTWKGKHSYRAEGHGKNGQNDYKKYFEMVGKTDESKVSHSMYPLWNAADYRFTPGGNQVKGLDNTAIHTGFHMRNFFESMEDLRTKYITYGHPLPYARWDALSNLDPTLNFTVKCVRNLDNDGDTKWLPGGYKNIVGARPIFFDNEEYRTKRHEQLRQMVEDDEKKYGTLFK